MTSQDYVNTICNLIIDENLPKDMLIKTLIIILMSVIISIIVENFWEMGMAGFLISFFVLMFIAIGITYYNDAQTKKDIENQIKDESNITTQIYNNIQNYDTEKYTVQFIDKNNKLNTVNCEVYMDAEKDPYIIDKKYTINHNLLKEPYEFHIYEYHANKDF